ncbi:MAG TPA: glucose 1-dehydrogenase [Acidimicrobiia bacterium]|nr:glucose 1-dehydrogenase [Acidimicrobiia bacterium]
MSPRFADRTALVTGAASGIGRATALRLAQEGAAVVVADIQEDAGREVVAEITSAGGRALFQPLDVSSEEAWAEAVASAEKEFGGLDVLVNNAGIGDNETIEETSKEIYDRVIAITQTSVFLGQKAASAALKRSGHGAVVNVSSMFGIVGGFGTSPAYHAAKGAVRLLTKSTALAWAKEGVRVNSVHPGFVDTPILGDTDREMLAGVTPMGRLAQPEELAALIVFLASDDASFITGSEFVADGGYTAS